MRRTALKLGTVGVLGVLGASSCNARDVPNELPIAVAMDEKHGGLRIGLVPVSGVTLSSLHYVVTNAATPPAIVSEGELPAAGPGDEISLGLSLPIGMGYRLSLSAASAEVSDKVTCGAAAGPFNVLPNNTSSFQLVLTCQDETDGMGTPATQVTTDACPRLAIGFVLADPSLGLVDGSRIHVSAAARDLDGKPVTYAWKASNPRAGTFTPNTAPDSDFTCTASVGDLLATVTATNGDCSKELSTPIRCIYLDGCGNGQVDPGESCDWSVPGSKCPFDCTYACGDGNAEAPVEDCDPGNTDNCDATCKFRVAQCGDGFLTTIGPVPEVCDGDKLPPGTPVGQTCSSTRTLLGDDLCGNGVVGPGEECDAPLTSPGSSSPTCSNSCKKISTPACVVCENAGDCFESVDNCLGVDAPFSNGDQSKCYDVMRCIEQTNCFDGTGTLGKCYCGSLSTTACGSAPFTGPGSPDGACVAQIKAGFPAYTANTQVLGGLTASKFPSGAAMKRLSCQKGANSSACLDVCGFTAGGPAFP